MAFYFILLTLTILCSRTLSDKVEDSSASVVKTSETVEPKVGQLEVHVEEKASPGS